MKPIKINIPDKGVVYWDDRKGVLSGDSKAVNFLRKKISAAVAAQQIFTFNIKEDYVEDSILASMGYDGMCSILNRNNIPLPDEIIAYYSFSDLVPREQFESYLERHSKGEIDDDPIIIPNIGKVYWELNEDENELGEFLGEFSGDSQAIEYLKKCYQKAIKQGLSYSIVERGSVYTHKISSSGIEHLGYDEMITLLEFYHIELSRHLYEYSHYDQPGVFY